MIRLGAIVMAIAGIGLILNPVIPFWLFASAVAILSTVWRILLPRSGPRPLRGASMVHVPADSEYGPGVCTKPPKSIRSADGDFPERHCMGYTPIEIAREELDSSEVRPYNGCTRGGADPWTKTGDSLSTCEGWPGKKAAEPRRNRENR